MKYRLDFIVTIKILGNVNGFLFSKSSRWAFNIAAGEGKAYVKRLNFKGWYG